MGTDYRIKDVIEIVLQFTDQRERIEVLRNSGFTVDDKPMKGYKVGQSKHLKNGMIYVQVGSNHGKWEYAPCVILRTQQFEIF